DFGPPDETSAVKFLQYPIVIAWKDFASSFFTRWMDHDNPTTAAAIAFYVLFALTPIFVFAVTFGGLVLGNDEAKRGAERFLSDYVGREQAAEMLQTIEITALSTNAIIPTLLSTIVMLWSSA